MKHLLLTTIAAVIWGGVGVMAPFALTKLVAER